MKYKIELVFLDEKDIDDINNFQKTYPDAKLIIRLVNTRGISTSKLLKINDSINTTYRVAGGFDEEREKRTNNSQYYENRNYYTRNELIEIVAIFEKIERDLLNKSYSELEVAYYIYNKLKKFIRYDDEFVKNKPNAESLLGLVYRRTSSYGYSLIYKEIMDRIGIKCSFVEGNNLKYAWNILKINGKHVCVDLAYDSYLFHKGNILDQYYFGNYDKNRFNYTHRPIRAEEIQDYTLNIETFEDLELMSINRLFKSSMATYTAEKYVRNDKSSFGLSLLEVIPREPFNLYKYLYCEYLTGGRMLKPKILISEVNFLGNKKRREELSQEIKNIEGMSAEPAYKQKEDELKKEYSLLKKYDDYIINEFITPNYISGLGENSYMGYFEYDGSKFSNRIVKELMGYASEVRKYRRDDGSIFIIEKIKEENGLFYYNYYDFFQTKEDNSLIIESNKIITCNNIIAIDKKYDKFVANIFFNKSRIVKCVNELAGFLGYCDFGDKENKEVFNGMNNSILLEG